MCGIAGIINRDGLTDDEVGALPAMAEALAHRGPDGSGVELDVRAGLVHTRLSIIDLAGGAQPLCNETGSVWITFNGEIYNYAELKKDLERKGHCFRTNSDTETIVHLYEELGEACVERLRGMFAFAIWDRNCRKLLLARDRAGIKPLYYAHSGERLGERLVFGSELKALLQAPGLVPRLCPEALLDYLTLLWIPGPRTIFAGVHKLPPGHLLTFDENGVRVRQYWDLEYNLPPYRESGVQSLESKKTDSGLQTPDSTQRLLEQLGDAVQSHLVADVPLGAFLSGGLDSSAIVATMARLGRGRVVTSSIGFAEPEYDELPHARAVARRFDTEHHEHTVQPRATEIVERLAWHFDEPFADASAIPCWYLSEMTRRAVKVALSGDGGDELFAGYRIYKFHQRERWVRSGLPLGLRLQVFGRLGRYWPKADWLPRPLRFKSTLENLGATHWEAMFRGRSFLDPEVARRLLDSDLRRQVGGYSPAEVFRRHYERCPARDPLNRDLYVDFKLYLPDDILTKADRTSMAHGLEVRVPLLDHRFAEFAGSLPARAKLRGGVGKLLFKNAMRPVLGTEIVDRPKQGFCVPLAEWFRGPLREMVEDTVFDANARIRSWLDVAQLQDLWAAHLQGRRQMSQLIWAVLMLEHWARRFLPAAGNRRSAIGQNAAGRFKVARGSEVRKA